MSFVVPNQPVGLMNDTNSGEECRRELEDTLVAANSNEIEGNGSYVVATSTGSGLMEQEQSLGGSEASVQNIHSENESVVMSMYPLRPNRRKKRTSLPYTNKREKGTDLKKDLKNFWDEVGRIQDNDKEKMMERALQELIAVLESFGAAEHASVAAVKEMLKEWPIFKDVDEIFISVKNIQELIKEANKNGSYNTQKDKLREEVLSLEETIKMIKKKREKDEHLVYLFYNKPDDPETMRQFREKFQSTEETSNSNLTAQGVSSSDLNAQGVSRTGYEDPAVVASPTKSFSFKYAEDFLKKLLGKENNKVEFSDFKCLQENFPLLEFNSIDSKLIKLCGKAYEEAGSFANEKLLVLAAIKEMGEESVDESMLLKWGAAFNKAEQAGYHMDFAKKRLELLACALFGTHSRILEKFNSMQKYVKAVSDVRQMKSFTDGMFPSDV